MGDAFHDFMGFTVAGPDHFIGSGHPLLTEELPPLPGLIESTDGGHTWRSASLLGQADFHAMRAAHDAVWGSNSSDGALMVSVDRPGGSGGDKEGRLFGTWPPARPALHPQWPALRSVISPDPP